MSSSFLGFSAVDQLEIYMRDEDFTKQLQMKIKEALDLYYARALQRLDS